MKFCRPITVDQANTDPLQDSEDEPITIDPCLMIVFYPEESTDVPADSHSVPITAGVFVITGELNEEGENIVVPVDSATLELSASGTGGSLDDSTLTTDEYGTAQTQLNTGTTSGLRYTVTARLVEFAFEGRTRYLLTGEEPTLTTAQIEVIPGVPDHGTVQVGRINTPSDELSLVEVTVSEVEDQYGNTVLPVPLTATLYGSSGAAIVENEGTVLSGMARLVLRSGSFPENMVLETNCGDLDGMWTEHTDVPFVDFDVSASSPAPAPADSSQTRSIKLTIPAVADGTPVYLYADRGVLLNHQATVFNGSAMITAQATGLPAGISTISGTVASKRVSFYGVFYEPDAAVDIEIEEKLLAGDRTDDGSVFVEQLDGPEGPPIPTSNTLAAVAAAGAASGDSSFVLVRAGTRVTIYGIPFHQYQVELRQMEEYQCLDYRLPPFFFHPFTPTGLPPKTVSKGFTFQMPAEGRVDFDLGSVGTWAIPTPRSQLLSGTVVVRNLTLDRVRTHQLTIGDSKLVAALKNFAAGFFAGGGEGGYALIGDLAANTIPFVGDIRDIIIELYHGVSGDEANYSQIGFSILGIVLDFAPGVGEIAGFCIGLIKRSLRKFVKPKFRKGIMAVGKFVLDLIRRKDQVEDFLDQILAISKVFEQLLLLDATEVEDFAESIPSPVEEFLLKVAVLTRNNQAFLDVFTSSVTRHEATRRLVETLGASPTMLNEVSALTEDQMRKLLDVLEKTRETTPAYLNRIVTNKKAIGPKYSFGMLIDTLYILRDTQGLSSQIGRLTSSVQNFADGFRYELDVAAYFVNNIRPIARMGRRFSLGSRRRYSDLDLSNGIVVQVKKGGFNLEKLEQWYIVAQRNTQLPWSEIYFVSPFKKEELSGSEEGAELLALLGNLGVKYQDLKFIPAS